MSRDVPEPGQVVRPLVRWYARARRDLPWRGSRDPYRVWVSEIMLQQTQVERVRDYFTRFMARFPDVAALARAREADVLKHWEGLGYYRRARQLHAAAREIAADHGGRFPRTVAELRRLPGVGRYTAGAIASIAFGARAPIIEANSRRVLARLVGHAAPVGGPAGDGALWEVAEQLVPAREPGLFNQALMDLGAGVCTPTQPLCGRCPLAAACVAHRTGRVSKIPAAAPRRATKLVRETAVVERRGGRVLVERRGPGEWWEGLWDFPRASRPVLRRRLGAAHAPSPDVHSGHPALRSLRAVCAAPSWLRWPAQAGSQGYGQPLASSTLIWQRSPGSLEVQVSNLHPCWSASHVHGRRFAPRFRPWDSYARGRVTD